MKNYWETQLEGYGAIVPDCPTTLPCYTVNPPLWALFRTLDPHAPEHPIFSEQEVVRRIDLMYFGDGTCSTG